MSYTDTMKREKLRAEKAAIVPIREHAHRALIEYIYSHPTKPRMTDIVTVAVDQWLEAQK